MPSPAKNSRPDEPASDGLTSTWTKKTTVQVLSRVSRSLNLPEAKSHASDCVIILQLRQVEERPKYTPNGLEVDYWRFCMRSTRQVAVVTMACAVIILCRLNLKR